jgi:hypothetical protein
MEGLPIEQFPLGRDSGEVASQPAFGCVRAELFERGLIVLHSHPSRLPSFPDSSFKLGRRQFQIRPLSDDNRIKRAWCNAVRALTGTVERESERESCGGPLRGTPFGIGVL